MKLAFAHVHYFLGNGKLGWHLKAQCKSKHGCEGNEGKALETEVTSTFNFRN
jgi:hypothetical protein